MAAPCALITSCSGKSPKCIIKKMLNVEELPEGSSVMENIELYPWHIETKYYTADIALCSTTARTIGDKKFADSVQAFVVHFDTQQPNSFEQAKSWRPFLKEIEPQIQMLVCERSTDLDVVPRQKVLEWCLDNSFELVELDPAEISDDEMEDDFKETTGISRIVQALHAHTWPNLVMKDEPTFRSPLMEQLMRAEALAKASQPEEEEKTLTDIQSHPKQNFPHSSHKAVTDTIKLSSDENNETKSETKKPSEKSIPAADKTPNTEAMISEEDMQLFGALGDEDPGDESFEQLFQRMKIMKEKAEALPPNQRKAYAEQVAISFWRAIGGDEDEIQGLSDSD